jgi:hypothetical protein
MTANVTCEYCKLPMDGIIKHDIKCRKYYDNKNKEDLTRGHK